MIKINIAFSKKVPVPGQQFSSLSYHASLDRELSDGLSGAQIQDEFRKGYSLLEQTVEAEINRSCGVAPAVAPTSQVIPERQAPVHKPATQEISATTKQLSLINRRGSEIGLTQAQINGHLMNCIQGKERVEQLTKKEASSFIDYLGNLQQRAA